MFTGDDPGKVRANRRRVARALGIPPEWASLKQVHGAEVVEVMKAASMSGASGDALTTATTSTPLAVLAADCLPVALTAPTLSAVAHAGWRGLCVGVLEAAVSRFRGEAPQAWIGPSIGPCHYQVGPDVVEAFRQANPESPAFWEPDGDRFRFDLRAAARWVLRRAGARVEEYEVPCTFCDQRFYSFRRDGETGRHAVVVWR